MLDRVHELARERRDFAFETTLASRTFAPWLKRLQADGYTFHLVYLCLPTVGMSVERVAERVRRGGHAVPEDVVRRRYVRSLDNFFSLYSRFANTWVMMDNSIRSRPRMIARGSAGRTVKVFNAGQWSSFQAQYGRTDTFKS